MIKKILNWIHFIMLSPIHAWDKYRSGHYVGETQYDCGMLRTCTAISGATSRWSPTPENEFQQNLYDVWNELTFSMNGETEEEWENRQEKIAVISEIKTQDELDKFVEKFCKPAPIEKPDWHKQQVEDLKKRLNIK